MDSNDAEYLYVMDTTATVVHPERIHEIVIDGKVISYTFKAQERTKMPFAHAMKFLKHDWMEVTDENGRPYKAAPGVELDAAGMPTITLPPDQVIANLNELTKEALRIRVHAEPGGEKFTKRVSIDKLIAFLIESRGAGTDEEPEPPSAGDEASEPVDMNPAEDENFFGNEGDKGGEAGEPAEEI